MNLAKSTRKPHRCPNCKSANISSYEPVDGNYDGGKYHWWQEEECDDCNAKWNIILRPIAVENIRVA